MYKLLSIRLVGKQSSTVRVGGNLGASLLSPTVRGTRRRHLQARRWPRCVRVYVTEILAEILNNTVLRNLI